MPTQRLHLPTFDKMMLPTVQALQQLGGSGTNDEIYETVIKIMHLPNDVLDVPHGNTGQSEVAYRLAWSRNYLKKAGILENSSRGVWAITSTASDLDKLDSKKITKYVRDLSKKSKPVTNAVIDNDTVLSSQTPDTEEEVETWDNQLHNLLLKLPPDAFERLAQRLLRESGFIHVEVTGKSGDGGIDGIGIARIAGFLSFHVLFQCKRYQGAVSASQIRDFRGAMQGRTDKGLFITTGTFSRDAFKEATRDGAPPIDLIDGEQLVTRLRELRLGVNVKTVEVCEVNTDWFASL